MKATTNTVYIDVFTDGSSYIGKDDYYEASSAVVLCMDKRIIYETGAFHPGGTNNYGETSALRLGLKTLNEDILPIINRKNVSFSIRIFSDSDFTIRSVKEYSHGWYKNANKSFDAIWMNTSKEPVACQDNFKYIYKHFILNKPFPFELYHIRGHVGEKISFNEAYKKFKKKNGVDISEEDFRYLVNMNHVCDELADKIRKEKRASYSVTYQNNKNNYRGSE